MEQETSHISLIELSRLIGRNSYGYPNATFQVAQEKGARDGNADFILGTLLRAAKSLERIEVLLEQSMMPMVLRQYTCDRRWKKSYSVAIEKLIAEAEEKHGPCPKAVRDIFHRQMKYGYLDDKSVFSQVKVHGANCVHVRGLPTELPKHLRCGKKTKTYKAFIAWKKRRRKQVTNPATQPAER